MLQQRRVNNHLEEQIIYSQQNMNIGSAIGQVRNRNAKLKHKRTKPQQDTKVAEDQVYDMARKSMEVLFQTHTVFPFDFFPDTLTINANKIDVVATAFFGSHQTTSVPLRDIANVEIQTAPFFATLIITNIRYPMHPLTLHYLKKEDATKAKNIIDGLLVAMSQGADIAKIEPKKLIHQLEQVGESAIE